MSDQFVAGFNIYYRNSVIIELQYYMKIFMYFQQISQIRNLLNLAYCLFLVWSH